MPDDSVTFIKIILQESIYDAHQSGDDEELRFRRRVLSDFKEATHKYAEEIGAMRAALETVLKKPD